MHTFDAAVDALHRGDVAALGQLLRSDPNLVHQRVTSDEAYFARPYLLWFVAENPVRTGTLPPNIADVARTIIAAGATGEAIDYALLLVCSGRVPRECGVQRALIDVLVDAGAKTEDALVSALAHHELEAVEHLLARGATLTLTAAVCTRRSAEAMCLLENAPPEERQLALTAAALYGNAELLAALVARGDVDVNSYSPATFHPHATPLHQAVQSGSLEAVRILLDAGASPDTRDRVYRATPLEWAQYLEKSEIAAYLESRR